MATPEGKEDISSAVTGDTVIFAGPPDDGGFFFAKVLKLVGKYLIQVEDLRDQGEIYEIKRSDARVLLRGQQGKKIK